MDTQSLWWLVDGVSQVCAKCVCVVCGVQADFDYGIRETSSSVDSTNDNYGITTSSSSSSASSSAAASAALASQQTELAQQLEQQQKQIEAIETRIDAALARVGMLDKRKRRMGALSGGERQRVLLAQGLIPEPQLLVLDEPMSALDEAGIQVFEQLLHSWRQSGTTVLWIEHDLEAVLRLADRVTGLSRKVLFDAPPAQALTPERLLGLFSVHPRSESLAR